MIENVLILNEMTKNYRVTFYSGDKNDFRMYINDKIVDFLGNDYELYLSKTDNTS